MLQWSLSTQRKRIRAATPSAAPEYSEEDGLPLFPKDDEDGYNNISGLGTAASNNTTNILLSGKLKSLPENGQEEDDDDRSIAAATTSTNGTLSDKTVKSLFFAKKSKSGQSKSQLDPTRAPKLAAMLIIAFFILTSILRLLEESGGTNTPSPHGSNTRGKNNKADATTTTTTTTNAKKANAKAKVIDDEDEEGEDGVDNEEEKDGNGALTTKLKKKTNNNKGTNNTLAQQYTDDNEQDKHDDNINNNNDNIIPGVSKSVAKNMKFKLPRVELTSAEMSYYADITEHVQSTDIPTFWHVPRSGGSTMKDMLARCLDLVQACEVGIAAFGKHHVNDTTVEVLQDVEGTRYVNVDTTTVSGIEHGIELGLAQSGLVDVIVTPFVNDAGRFFDANHRGRMFTLLRHPVERAASMYYYLRSDPAGQKILKGKSLEQYAKSDLIENNWMVRFLSNQLAGELTPENEALAREVLRRKCLVGLLSEKRRSMERFEAYFGWKIAGEKMEDCHEKLIDWSWSNKHKHPPVKEGSDAWNMLEEQNSFDIRLYGYAQELFKMQEIFFKADDAQV